MSVSWSRWWALALARARRAERSPYTIHTYSTILINNAIRTYTITIIYHIPIHEDEDNKVKVKDKA